MGKNGPPKWINRTLKGSIHYRKDRGYYFVSWYDRSTKKRYKIYRYRGLHCYSRKMAEKLLATMQADHENGTFRIDKYLKDRYSDTVEYMQEWLETIRPTLAPSTYKDYRGSIKNHLEPFFLDHPVALGEIGYDILVKLLHSIDRTGKGKLNVMLCFHRCMKFAYQSRRISELPPFPERSLYKINKPTIKWVPEHRQIAIIEAIPEEHRPIFWWLKYHLRRPGEACALHVSDYSLELDAFTVQRGVSARQLIDRTKTGYKHLIPCHSAFKPIIPALLEQSLSHGSPFMFTNAMSRKEGKRYRRDTLRLIWNKACKLVGESITLYAGLKHSSCSSLVNEKGLSISDLQSVTDHKRRESVEQYATVELARKRQLMEGNVVPLDRNRGNTGDTKTGTGDQ